MVIQRRSWKVGKGGNNKGRGDYAIYMAPVFLREFIKLAAVIFSKKVGAKHQRKRWGDFVSAHFDFWQSKNIRIFRGARNSNFWLLQIRDQKAVLIKHLPPKRLRLRLLCVGSRDGNRGPERKYAIMKYTLGKKTVVWDTF